MSSKCNKERVSFDSQVGGRKEAWFPLRHQTEVQAIPMHLGRASSNLSFLAHFRAFQQLCHGPGTRANTTCPQQLDGTFKAVKPCTDSPVHATGKTRCGWVGFSRRSHISPPSPVVGPLSQNGQERGTHQLKTRPLHQVPA